MPSNAYFLAKFRFDTAENEPAENLQNFAKFANFAKVTIAEGDLVLLPLRASVGKISAKCCSLSAVSAPIFARKYAFCSIFQNLPDSQAEIFEI